MKENVLIITSLTDYSNNNLIIQWLKHFNKHFKKMQIEYHKMLIMNEFDSHNTYKFWQSVKRKQILLFWLSSHFTHLMQSLNVEIFQPLKYHYTEVIDAAVRVSNVNFNKLNFLTSFQTIQTQTFIKFFILSAWKNTELIFYNSQIILSKVERIQISKKAVTSSSSLTSAFA